MSTLKSCIKKVLEFSYGKWNGLLITNMKLYHTNIWKIYLAIVLGVYSMSVRCQTKDEKYIHYEAIHIDSIDSVNNQGRPLLNNIYVIYAVSADSTHYKIFSHFNKDISIKNMNSIEIGQWYIMPLVSILRGPLSKIGACYTLEITGTVYEDNMVEIEPNEDIWDLHAAPKLNGLFYLPQEVYLFNCEHNTEGKIILPTEYKNMLYDYNNKSQNQICSSHTEIMTEPHKSDEVFKEVEEMPSFVGGQEKLSMFIKRNIQYTPSVFIDEIQAQVIVRFVIEKDGSISNVKTVKIENIYPDGTTREQIKIRNNLTEKSFTDANAEFQAEAERIVKIMPKWNPGKKDGKRVRVGMTIPINFLLE